MGMDIHSTHATIRFNWAGWNVLTEILHENGFKGLLPNRNDGDTIDPVTAKEVGKAILRWYEAKDKKSRGYPKLEPWESHVLAYALLLTTEDGNATHD